MRVLEIGSFTSAPLAGRYLAMLGADVLKVEPPSGENSRHLAQQVGGSGYLYWLNNTDKRGCVLDIRKKSNRERLDTLVRDADIVLCNLAPSTARAAGLTAERLRTVNPDVIYCLISGFGAVGSRADEKAFDTIIQALAGIMSLTGSPEGPPLKVAISFADLLGACVSTAGVLAAIRARRRGRTGLTVDVSMFDAAVWSAQEAWPEVLSDGGAPARMGNRNRTRAPHGAFEVGDGKIVVDVPDNPSWGRLVDALGIAGDDRLDGAEDQEWRLRNQDVVDAVLSEAFSTRSLTQVLMVCRRCGVSAAPVLDLAGLVHHPHTTARNLLRQQHLRDDLEVTVLGPPFRFTRAAVEVRRPAPPLGDVPPSFEVFKITTQA